MPAAALVVGARLAHDTRCAALGKRPISMPISPDELLCADPAHAGDRIQLRHLVATGRAARSIRPARLLDLGAERVDAAGHHL
ncbi:MAG TPA: hypothetical protein VGJ86_06930 [Acidimicrobiales bacterium]